MNFRRLVPLAKRTSSTDVCCRKLVSKLILIHRMVSGKVTDTIVITSFISYLQETLIPLSADHSISGLVH